MIEFSLITLIKSGRFEDSLIHLTKRQKPPILLAVADVAELADAQASGACGLRLVEVRLLSSALKLFCKTANRPFWPHKQGAIAKASNYLTKITRIGR